MRIAHIVPAVFFLCVSAIGATSADRSKEEIVRWCAQNREAIRFVGYQGSDSKQHHYIVRIMDSWTFFQIRKEELTPDDERPFPSASSAQVYYYLVDPLRNFEKSDEREEANQQPQRNAGSRPVSSDSPASATPSAPAPRG